MLASSVVTRTQTKKCKPLNIPLFYNANIQTQNSSPFQATFIINCITILSTSSPYAKEMRNRSFYSHLLHAKTLCQAQNTKSHSCLPVSYRRHSRTLHNF